MSSAKKSGIGSGGGTSCTRSPLVSTESVLHVLAGRVRVKLSAVKGAPEQAREIENRLSEFVGIEKVTANPTTGSVLVFYDTGRTGVSEIVDALRCWGYLSEPEFVPQQRGSI